VSDRRDDGSRPGQPIDRRLFSRSTNDAAARLRNVAARAGRLPNEEADLGAKTNKPGRADYLAVKAALQERLLDEIGERGLLENDDADVAAAVQDLPRAHEIRFDAVVIAYTLIAAAVIGLVLGLIPAVASMGSQVLGVLREEGRSATVGRGAQSLRRALVVAQVGCAFVLLIGAGLLFATFRKALAVDPGFMPAGVLTAAVSLPNARYPDAAALRRFTDEALRRVRALATVTVSGATDSLPLGNNWLNILPLTEVYGLAAPLRLTSGLVATSFS